MRGIKRVGLPPRRRLMMKRQPEMIKAGKRDELDIAE
jgi:hypothetical protein